jgi:hypothetical protein
MIQCDDLKALQKADFDIGITIDCIPKHREWKLQTSVDSKLHSKV